MLTDLRFGESGDFADQKIRHLRHALGLPVLNEAANPPDDYRSATRFALGAINGLPGGTDGAGARRQKTPCRLRIAGDRGQRLGYLMGERDCHFVHRLHAIGVRDLLQAQAREFRGPAIWSAGLPF